jgi:hypothetical protein
MSEPSLPDLSATRLRLGRSDGIECRFAADADVEFAATLVEAAARASPPIAAPQRR